MADLLALAVQAVTVAPDGTVEADSDMGTVLGDAILETGWRHPAVMPLVLGVSLDDVPPRGVHGSLARERWRARREAGLELSQEQWDLFAERSHDGKVRPHAKWVRAVYAVLLFDGWQEKMRSTPRSGRRWSTKSPWPLVRAAVAKWSAAPTDAQETRETRGEWFALLDEATEPPSVQSSTPPEDP